jgi:thiol:disulfide interchange protein
MHRSWIGGLALAIALLFVAALWFDVGGLQSKLFSESPGTPHLVLPRYAPVAAPQPPSQSITPAWFLGASGYDGAELERQAARASMLVYFQKRACDGCRKFEKGVLAAPEVKSFLDGIVKVRVDPDDGEREQKLAKRFGVGQLPAVAVVPPQGPPRLLPDAALRSPHDLIAFSR